MRNVVEVVRYYATFLRTLLTGAGSLPLPSSRVFTFHSGPAGGTAKLRNQIPMLRAELFDVVELLMTCIRALVYLWLVTALSTVLLTIAVIAAFRYFL